MTNIEKLEQIKNLCDNIMALWKNGSRENDPYEGGKVIGRSILAETILQIIVDG